MQRIVLVLWSVAALACGKSSVVAPAPVPTSLSATVMVPSLTIVASIVITIEGTAVVSTAIQGPFQSGVPVSVSFTFSVKTDAADSVKDVLVDWGDGETTDLGAGSQSVAYHSYSTAG